jgi:uncharacterized protein involved in type VI secretion and phage assembly
MSGGPPFWGKFRGVVSDVDDPLQLGRIKARVADIYGSNESGWAMPCAPFGGASMGFFALPKVGAGVWIELEHGDPDYPVWTGAFWTNASDRPSVLASQPSEKVLIQTTGGHKLTFDDGANGGITIETSGGQKIKLTSQGIELDNGNGAKISMTSSKVSVNDGALEVQ